MSIKIFHSKKWLKISNSFHHWKVTKWHFQTFSTVKSDWKYHKYFSNSKKWLKILRIFFNSDWKYFESFPTLKKRDWKILGKRCVNFHRKKKKNFFKYSRGPDRGIEPTPRKLAENQVFTPEARLREGKGHKWNTGQSDPVKRRVFINTTEKWRPLFSATVKTTPAKKEGPAYFGKSPDFTHLPYERG